MNDVRGYASQSTQTGGFIQVTLQGRDALLL